jgi:hypothetical protein
MRTEPDRKTEHRSESGVQVRSDCCAVARTGMRSNCAVLDLLAPPFVSRQKVESNKSKKRLRVRRFIVIDTTIPFQETRLRRTTHAPGAEALAQAPGGGFKRGLDCLQRQTIQATDPRL